MQAVGRLSLSSNLYNMDTTREARAIPPSGLVHPLTLRRLSGTFSGRSGTQSPQPVGPSVASRKEGRGETLQDANTGCYGLCTYPSISMDHIVCDLLHSIPPASRTARPHSPGGSTGSVSPPIPLHASTYSPSSSQSKRSTVDCNYGSSFTAASDASRLRRDVGYSRFPRRSRLTETSRTSLWTPWRLSCAPPSGYGLHPQLSCDARLGVDHG